MKFTKPKFWDFQKPNIYAYLLLPFTLPVRLNNFLSNHKSKIKPNEVKTICVGNIYLGGTGKTPSVIKLFEILKKIELNVVTAKKFYSSQKDEIVLLENKTNFISAKKRVEIIEKAMKNNYKIVIFDDGLQDKSIDYDLKFVCFNSKNWIGNGELIPSGPLREKVGSLKNYDAVFLKNIDNPNYNIINLIKNINPKIKIFNTYYKINNLKNFDLKKRYLIFSGIGNPDNFKNILIKHNFDILDVIIYPDHYEYTQKDILKIKKKASDMNAKIITTEKDFVKIPTDNRNDINFLDVNLEIIEEKDLLMLLKSKMYE
jgi:tetraacyldisaccharide 4'-kinase